MRQVADSCGEIDPSQSPLWGAEPHELRPAYPRNQLPEQQQRSSVCPLFSWPVRQYNFPCLPFKMGKNKNSGGGKGGGKGGDDKDDSKDAGAGMKKEGVEIKVRHILW